MRKLLFIIFLLSLFLRLGWSAEGDRGFDPNEERRGTHFQIDDIGRLILGYSHRAYEDISDELFDRVSTYSVGVPINEYSTIVGQVRRKIYDNRDGTFTVLDLFGVQGIVSPGESRDVAGLPLYAAIGAENGYDFVNIRQYDHIPEDETPPAVLLPDDPWVVDLWQGVTRKWFGVRYIYDALHGTWNFFMSYFRSPSDAFEARYEDMLNLVQTPFRLPLDVETFNAMAPGEIMSYTIFGGIFLTFGTGMAQEPWNANLGINFYRRGAHRITIFREKNGNFAKVKVSYLTSSGRTIGGKIKGDFDLLEGVFFGQDVSASFVPFRIAVNKGESQVFDTLYRYDMRTAQGVEAYESAVFGNFIPSESLNEAESGVVQKLYEKDVDTDTNAFFLNFNVLLWNSKKTYELDHSLITLRDKEGINYVFRSVSKNEIIKGNLFRSHHEEMNYLIESTIELENPERSLRSVDPLVVVSLFISDRETYGDELREYCRIVEGILGNPSLFDEGQYRAHENYDKLSIDLHFKFSQEAINKILISDEEVAWGALAKAFGQKPEQWATGEARQRWVTFDTYFLAALRVRWAIERIRLFKEAKSIMETFKRIREEEDVKVRASQLTEFHRGSPFQWEILTVMLSLSEFRGVWGSLVARGSHFEEKNLTWGDALDVGRPDEHKREENEMDGRPIEPRFPMRDIILAHPESEPQFTLSFVTDTDPAQIEGFYLRLHEVRPWVAGWLWWRRGALLYETPHGGDLYPTFRAGEKGKISISLNELLTEPFVIGNRYELLFSYRTKDARWSQVKKIIFEYQRSENMYIQWRAPDRD